MKKADKILRYVRLYLILLLITGSFFGFPNDPALCGIYWAFVLFGEIVCFVGSK